MDKCLFTNCNNIDINEDQYCILHSINKPINSENKFLEALKAHFHLTDKGVAIFTDVLFPDISFTNATIISLSNKLSNKELILELSFYNCRFQEFEFNVKSNISLSFTNCLFNDSLRLSSQVSHIIFHECQIKTNFIINKSHIQNLKIYNNINSTPVLNILLGTIEHLSIIDCNFAEFIYNPYSAKTLSIHNCTIEKVQFQFEKLSVANLSSNKILLFEILGGGIESFIFQTNSIDKLFFDSAKVGQRLSFGMDKISQINVHHSNCNYVFIDSLNRSKIVIVNSSFSNLEILESEIDINITESSFNKGLQIIKSQIYNNVIIDNSTVSRIFELKKLKIADHSSLIFNNVIFTENTISDITQLSLGDNSKTEFIKCLFQEFKTQFSYNTVFDTNSYIAIKYCDLQNVYFSNNYISKFSFYKSAFDKAIFTLNRWKNVKDKLFYKIQYTRRNILFEEDGGLTDNDIFRTVNESAEEIASLYRRFKNTHDNQKNYEVSGWFYFNEFETKRKGLTHEYHIQKFWQSKIKSKLFIYTCYKIFAGYGEKPSWSFWWFTIFTVIFTIVNMMNGFKINNHIINYDFAPYNLTIFKDPLFWRDILSSFLYTIYRILPLNYLPFSKDYFSTMGVLGICVALVNTLVLFLLLTLTFIGLKRIFRRF